MAEKYDDSIFAGIFNALRKGGRDTKEADRGILTNTQAPSPFSTKQQKQQDFLDIQSNRISEDLYTRSMYYEADRFTAYQDYRAMDNSPEVSAALDILSDECLEASTIIPLLNGSKKTIEELYNEKLNNFWVYSYNPEKEIVEPAICEKVVFKGEQDVYEIIFDDNSFVMATSEHLWLMKKTKEYTKTSDLKINNSIQPFYTRISTEEDRINGYEMVLENNGKWEYTHRIVKRKLWPEKKGVVHHSSFNKLNNDPYFLEVMDFFEHQKMHSSLNSFRWKNDKEYSEKMSKVFSKTNSANGKYWSDPEWRKWRTEKATISINKFIETTTPEQRKEIYGNSGETNGMYGNGYKLSGEKNGRYKKDKKHEFSKEELIEAFLNTENIDEVCEYLNTVKSILWKSKEYKNINRQSCKDELAFISQNISFEKIDEICNSFLGKLNLERSLNVLCERIDFEPKTVKRFLKKHNTNWEKYSEKFNSRELLIENLKKIVLSTPGIKDIKKDFRYICRYNDLDIKKTEGIIYRSEYKKWSNFVDGINHSIKSIRFVGKRKTYDLVNAGEHHNFAILTSNGTGVFSHNCVSKSEKGEILGIYSDNSRVKNTLKDLFYNVLNINYNLGFWTRELLKFGDTFLKLEVDQNAGVYDVIMLPVGEIHRIENKGDEIGTSKFHWDANNLYFEEWQVAHFRILTDSSRLPYGRAILEPARKLWRQLQLAEDAMLVYRAVRAPERRVYYIEVGNIDPADVPQYMEKAKASVKKTPMVNAASGTVNLKFAPMPVWKNTPIPLLDGRTITIEELAKEFEEGKENFVYSIQDKTHQVVGGKVIWCGKNYTANKLTKVWLDDNTWVLTAPEHPFILRDGTCKRADELISGDALMPYYEDFERIYKEEKNTRTYKRVYNPNSGKYEYVHRLIGKEIKKGNEKHNTLHHKNFIRYDNSFSNLEWVDFHEHRKMHSEVAKKNITKYNKSEEKIKRVSELNIERNSIQHMSWYNSSDLHKEHDEIRSKNLTARWDNIESKKELKNSMTIKVDKNCFNLIIEEIKKYENFVNAEDFIKGLKNTEVYFLIKELNKNSKRNVDTFFNSKGNLRKVLRENGIKNYEEFLQNFNPLLLGLKKENYRNARIEWNENNLITNEKGQYEYKNHKVLRVETIFENEDVYCMTVVGNEGQHDRHNFALYSFNESGYRTNSGVFVKNSYEEDYFLPVRGDKSSRIETLPGACLALDTKIELLDGRSLELQEIIKEWDNGNKNLWSYSINPNTGEIVPGIITWAGITRKDTQVVKITLDNGETITVTPDHKFPTKLNGVKEAKDLLIDELLFAFNKYKDTNLENHKIVSIEWLEEKQDTGTITIDGNELYHNFHNFALSCGVFTSNSNLGEIADIEYLQNKLFAALKVPKPYLNYAETIPGGSALSQADLRFSRTINRLQQFLVIELRRIANIHLYFLGFEDDINNFELTLTNPSTQQELLKLETMKSRLEVFKELFTNDPTSPVSYTWAMQYIMGFSESEIKQILRQKKIERKMFAEIEGAADEYVETGIFSDLDRKFRRPDFVPGQPAGGAGDEAGAGAGAGGGGGISGGGLGSGLDMGGGIGGDLGGAPDASGGAEGDIGTDANGDSNGDMGDEAPLEEPLAENSKQKNKLQKNNAAVNHRTRMLMENITKHLKSLDEGMEKNNDDELIQG